MITELERPASGKKTGRPKKTLSSAPPSSNPHPNPLPKGEGERVRGEEVKVEPKPFILIDHPKNREKIAHSHHYAIRIGAEGGESVEISIDNGNWHPCRQAEGYFWYDWHHIPSGKHKLTARLKLANGKEKKSKITRVEVI